jgi:hypothetical protein
MWLQCITWQHQTLCWSWSAKWGAGQGKCHSIGWWSLHTLLVMWNAAPVHVFHSCTFFFYFLAVLDRSCAFKLEVALQAQESAESCGATHVEIWSKKNNATHVVCESRALPKYIGLNLHLVSVSTLLCLSLMYFECLAYVYWEANWCHTFWFLAQFIPKFFHGFQKLDRNARCKFLYNCLS